MMSLRVSGINLNIYHKNQSDLIHFKVFQFNKMHEQNENVKFKLHPHLNYTYIINFMHNMISNYINQN